MNNDIPNSELGQTYQSLQEYISVYNIIIECLDANFKSDIKNSDRKRYATQLESLNYGLFSNFDKFLEILAEDQKLSENSKLAFLVHIRSLFTKDQFIEKLNEASIISAMTTIVNFSLSNKFNGKCLKNLTSILEQLFNADVVVKNGKITGDFMIYLVGYVQDKPINLYNSVALTVQNIFNSRSVRRANFKEMVKIFAQLFQGMLNKLFSLVTQEENEISASVSSGQATDFSHFITLMKSIESTLNGVYKVCLSLKKKPLTTKRDKNYSNIHMLKSTIDIMLESFVSSTCSFATYSFFKQSTVVSWNKNFPLLNDAINTAKSFVYRLHSLLLNNLPEAEFLSNSLEYRDIFGNLLISTVVSLEWTVNNEFAYIVSNDGSISEEYPNCAYKLLVYNQLIFVSRALSKVELSKLFEVEYKDILMKIVFPLLVDVQGISSNSTQDDSEYSNVIHDLIIKQDSKTIRCVAAYILQIIPSIYEGSIIYIIKSLFQIIHIICKNNSCNSSIIENQKGNLQSLVLTPNSFFLDHVNAEQQIDTCLISMSIINQAIKTELECYDLTKSYISAENLFITMLDTANESIIASLLTFIKYYNCGLFKSNDDELFSILKFVFDKFTHTNPRLSYLAVDCVSEIYSNQSNLKLLPVQKITSMSLNIIVDGLENMNIPIIYDILYDIINNYPLQSEVVCALITKCSSIILKLVSGVTRITFKKESSAEKKQEKQNTKMIKTFNVIRTICEKDVYVHPNINLIEECLRPIIMEMKGASKVEFDEDVILILTSLIKIIKRIPDICYLVFPYLHNYISKIQGFTPDLAELLNCLIIYGAQILAENTQFYEMITKTLKKSLKDDYEYNYCGYQASLIIQSLITTIRTIPEKYVKELMQIVIKTINFYVDVNYDTAKKKLQFHSDSDRICFLGFLTTIYSGFIYYHSVTYEIICSMNYFDNLFNWTDAIIGKKFLPTFQIKLIVIGLCAWIKVLYIDYREAFELALKMIMKLLNKQVKLEENNLDYKIQSYTRPDDAHEDKSDNEDNDDCSDFDEESVDSAYEVCKSLLKQEIGGAKSTSKSLKEDSTKRLKWLEVNEITSRSINPMKEEDEFSIFRVVMVQLISQNVLSQESLTQDLSLKDLLYTKRVVLLSDIKIDLKVPRKVYRIKRKGN